MRERLSTFISEALEEMDPIISFETTDYGWRGLSRMGEVHEVRGVNGHKVEPPQEVIVAHDGKPIGRRRVSNEFTVDIDDYLKYFNHAVDMYRKGRLEDALAASDICLSLASTLRARFNRSMILLAMGRWTDGFAEYLYCEHHKPFLRPMAQQALDYGLQPWRGEALEGKRLLLLHAHGYGDTIMCLRYAHWFDDALLVAPPELLRIAEQHVEVVPEIVDADYFCPILHLPYYLRVTPSCVVGDPYLKLPQRTMRRGKRRVGIAWSVGKPSPYDYPRPIELDKLVAHFKDVELHSVQVQGADEAERHGVIAHDFKDFEECAQLMAQMDEIISVDTAALHLAGAIGHSKVTGLLSHWASWRWVGSWYNNVRLLRQASPGDWGSVLSCL